MPRRSIPPGRLLLGWAGDRSAVPGPAGFHVRPPEAPAPDTPLLADDEGHLVTIAPTGAGKGRSALIPALLTYDGAVVVIDPKGEAARVTARHRRRYGPVVVVDPYRLTTQAPDTLNPLDLLAHSGQSVAEVALMLAGLLAPATFAKDPFWDNRATSLVSGLLACILACEPPERRHPGTLRALLASDDPAYSIALLLDTFGKKMGTFAYEELSQFLHLPERETRGSVQATASQHVLLFGEDAVAESVRTTSFSLDAFKRGDPLTIYLVLPVTKLNSHGALLRLWLGTLLHLLMERTARPERPTLLLLDEVAQLGRLNALVTATTLLRGYGVRVWSFWQDLSQMKALYPAEWETILTNTRTLQVFGAHWLFQRTLADLLHLPPATLRALEEDQLLVSPDGAHTLSRRPDYLRDPGFAGRFDPNPLFSGPDRRAASPEAPGREGP